jgi:DNA-binding CsgD family transcriptional regulator/predicted ATPase
MVGRGVELRLVLAALEGDEPALVSITGVAGAGKSTLAAAVAETLADEEAWAVAWADVASEPAATPFKTVVQRCLGVDDLEPATLVLATYGRRVLVVLDGTDDRSNEVEEALAPLTDCPSVRVMLTSVRGIRGPDVVTVPIGGLEVPSIEVGGPDLANYPSVELYLAAARAVGPGLPTDERALFEVAEICRGLDGLPLAVILAARRLRTPLSPAARMSRRVQADPTYGLMLSAGQPDARSGGHQDSVRAALDWTYSLLGPTPQRVLRRSCVFQGPFGLEAAEQVCELSRYELLEPLEELASLGLLKLGPDEAAEIRYEIHPLVRAFGTEALAETDEVVRCSDLHAELLSRLARRASHLDDRCDSDADLELRTVEPDLYAALDHLIDAGRRVEALSLAADLGHLAIDAGLSRDLLARLDRLLADVPPDADRGVLADALLWAAELEVHAVTARDTVERSRRNWNEGMKLARAEGEPYRQLRGFSGAVAALPVTGDFAETKAAVEAGLRLAREVGSGAWLARFTAWSGMVAHMERDFATAARLADEGLGIALRSSDRHALILVGLLVSGMPEEHAPKLALIPPLDELYAMALDIGDRQGQSWLLGHLIARAAQRGDYLSAVSWIVRRVDLVRGSRDWDALGFSLMGSVSVLTHIGHPKLAARVHGSLAAIMPVLIAGVGARDERAYSNNVSELEAILGHEVFEEQVRAGSGDDWAELLLDVLPVLSEAAAKKRSGTARLTGREAEVLRLLSEGKSNKDIANRLGVSAKTVMHHTVSVYRKLGVSGRSEAAATAIKMGLGGPG